MNRSSSFFGLNKNIECQNAYTVQEFRSCNNGHLLHLVFSYDMIRILGDPKYTLLLPQCFKFRCVNYQNLTPIQILIKSRTAASDAAISWTRASDIDKRANYSFHWTMERVVSAALLAIFPASYFIIHPSLDYLLATSIVLHSHWGMEVVAGDYADRWDRYNRYNFFGPAANFSVLLTSAALLGGLFYFNYADVGIREAIRLLWHEI